MSRSIGKATSLGVALWLLVPTPGAAGAQSTTVVRRPTRPTAAGALVGVHVDTAALHRLAGVGAVTASPATTPPVQPPPPTPQQPAAKKISRARLESVLGGGAAAKISVVRAAGEVAALPPTRDSVAIRPGELVFRKTSDTALRVAARTTTGATGHPLPPGPGDTTQPSHPSPTLLPTTAAGPADATYAVPYRWLMVDSAGVERVLVPYFVLDGGGLTYDVATRTYRGTALVGVEDTLHPGEGPVVLPRSLPLLLTTTSSGGRVVPRQLAIGHTSLTYDSVTIVSTDSTQVRIQTAVDPRGIVVPIPVRAITIGLEPAQPTLQGLGLAATDIRLTLPRGMSRTDAAVIVLKGTHGSPHPDTVRVTGASPSTVRLRSGTPGTDSIRAFLDNVQVGQTAVTFEPPWSFTGATLAGLLLGGFARFFGAKRRKRTRALGWDLLKGAPFGVIAAAASAVGLDLLQLRIDDPGTWVAVMLTAAIGAWTGSRLLERGAGGGGKGGAAAPGGAPTTPTRPAPASLR